MSSTDFNMLWLEAPRDILQITSGEECAAHVEIASPASWIRCLVRHQAEAERDLRQLYEACGNQFDRSDVRIRAIESAYNELLGGAQYLYEQTQNNHRIAEEWIRTELANTANAYQTFTRQVWEGISAHTADVAYQQIHQATQLTRLHDALAYQAEANIARGQHLAKFEGDVTNWAAQSDARARRLEEELAAAKNEIQQLAGRIPLPSSRPATPAAPTYLRGPPPLPAFGGSGGGTPPRGNRPPLRSPSSTPSLPPIPDEDDDLYNLPPRAPPPQQPEQPGAQAIARLVGEGVVAAMARLPARDAEPEGQRLTNARLKMKNPDTFDGKPTTPFST
jgi:hypothetical protein